MELWNPTKGLLHEALKSAHLSVEAQIERALEHLWVHSRLLEVAVGHEPDGVVRLYARFEAGLLEAGKNGRGYISLWAGDDDDAFEGLVAKMREVARELPHCDVVEQEDMVSFTYSEQE